MNRLKAQQLLQMALADSQADFRDGQWEAIDAVVNRRQKLLVVQRTGWGKSAVYFISAKIFRDRNLGPTIIISPLLALMRNQIDAARRLGINAVTMNSTNTDNWQAVTRQILADEIDCLLISPERLANDKFVETVLQPIADRIALMVVDEAHCISDWGHDFRPDYRRIVNILRFLPANTPVLGTTATANNRVIADIKSQLGDIHIQRGSLIRDSLSLQTMVLPDQAARLAWLAQTIPTLGGTGIVYALTKRDAEQVADWLQQNGINAKAYYSGVEHSGFTDSDSYRQHLEDSLLNNQLTVLVATTALGMGYDKPDLRFVIHYQAPGSIVGYYQQVGRAGRGIDSAYGVLLSGTEDQQIHEYFRESAFPSEDEVRKILHALENADGLAIQKIEKAANLRYRRIENALKYLASESPSPVLARNKTWYRTPVHFSLDWQRINIVNTMRKDEWTEVNAYINTKDCLMSFLRGALDDPSHEPCGKCEACLTYPVLNKSYPDKLAAKAIVFLKRTEKIINPRKEIAQSNEEAVKTFPVDKLPRRLGELVAQPGRMLSQWKDAGWGWMVADDKHAGRFRDELVVAMAEMIKGWQPEPFPSWVCCVPSLNHPELVRDFARRLADALGLPFIDVVKKVKANAPQKLQQNRFHQCRNLDGVFVIDPSNTNNGSVFLVDDIIDSGWTFTVIAALLQQAGSGKVYPCALASSSTNE
ncbi:MAG: RecQ family ATP-dependent DNA helicase [Methylobacter sp.]|nr:RecQ family ATP-dependent DNA helicase [Methylobacter sp.]